MAEHSPQWSPEMQSKVRAYLAVPVDYFGPDCPLAEILRQDATELKKLVQALPANRNTRPETRGLTLQEALALPGAKKISAKTVNSYIDTFRRFWDWAARHGHAPRRCCRTLTVEDSPRESMWLDGWHEQAITRPLPHDELVQLHCGAAQARLLADLAGQGDGLACAA